MTVMAAGLLASMVLNVLIGWPDAFGALTFAQRVTGALFVLSGAVQGAAALLAFDHGGRREIRSSGAIVLLGAVIALATDSLLILLWLEEKEYTPYLLAFMPLWCWSLWALVSLLREKAWKGVPHPKKFAAGVFATALLTGVSLAYSTLYQPATAPMRLLLAADFGTARADPARPFVQVPLKLTIRNTGDVSVYVVIDDFGVYGRTAAYSEKGDSSAEAWKESFRRKNEEADRHVDRLSYHRLSTGRFYEPGDVLEAGQEDTRVHVFQVPRDVPYDLLHVDMQVTYMRKDRGRIDVEHFSQPLQSWRHPRFACRGGCSADTLTYLGRVRHNNNLINVTRKPLYVTAFWSPDGSPKYSVSSFHFTGGWIDKNSEKREVGKFGVATRYADGEVSVAELLGSISDSPR
jgi:hypothetical protein